MIGAVDLHTHSTASDGTLAPSAVIDLAASAGLAGIALTDHDTLAGLEEARGTSVRLGIRFMAGMEMSACWHDLPSVHILGYRVDGPCNQPLLDGCERLRNRRRLRAEEIVRKLNLTGVAVRLEKAEILASSGLVGRPHLARALVAGGWAATIPEAFRLWLGPGTPGYTPLETIPAEQAVDLLLAAGAVPVLAHPQALELAPGDLDAFVKRLVDRGLMGVEAYWSQHDAPMVEQCLRFAKRYNLIATGGSDFHGENKPNRLGDVALGHTLGLDLMDALESAAASI